MEDRAAEVLDQMIDELDHHSNELKGVRRQRTIHDLRRERKGKEFEANRGRYYTFEFEKDEEEPVSERRMETIDFGNEIFIPLLIALVTALALYGLGLLFLGWQNEASLNGERYTERYNTCIEAGNTPLECKTYASAR